MSAVWAALVALLQSLVGPASNFIKSWLTFQAGETAADDAARKAQEDAENKADAAREAAHSDAVRNPGGLRDDDGFRRPD